MNPIINISFKNTHIICELIHCRLLHISENSTKSMCRHQTMNVIPKHCPNKTTAIPCTVYYKEK